MTRRYKGNMNGERFLGNTNKKEVHDLDNEDKAANGCQIDEITLEVRPRRVRVPPPCRLLFQLLERRFIGGPSLGQCQMPVHLRGRPVKSRPDCSSIACPM